jgi:hypothetical protein
MDEQQKTAEPGKPAHFDAVTEQKRLNDAREAGIPWKQWGPYLSERQWGTVREDYSENGNAWDYFSHDQSRSRAYRWGEDGLGGISDDKQRLCFALALRNESDPILKERLFGLTNSEGNHGEDVKEYYFYGSGRRPVYGGSTKFQNDPYWRDLILFYEYFHGDNGAGLGARHQTGWTGTIALLLDLFGRVGPAEALTTPQERLRARLVKEQVRGVQGS